MHFISYYYLLVPHPDSVNLLSNKVNPVWPNGSDITLTCVVELNPAANFSLLMAYIQLSRNENPLAPTGTYTRNDTTFTYATQLNSFMWNDSGNYTCIATFRSTIPHITMSDSVTDSINITTGFSVFLLCIIYVI